MKMIKDYELRELLLNPIPGGSNQYIADCPYCNKQRHFYISRITGAWDCKKCQEVGNLNKLMFHLGKRVEFIKKSVEVLKPISLLKDNTIIEEGVEEEQKEVVCKVQKLPIGFKRIYNHPYLQGRHFTEQDYKYFRIGITDLKQKYEKYILFSIDEDGECRGFVGRCTESNGVMKRNELKRYENSMGTKFGNLLFGYDLLKPNTETVILVEGLFDVIRLNNFLNLYQDDSMKCVATFGKKISITQIIKLKRKFVKKIILLYDPDAIRETKKFAAELMGHFEDVKVGYFFNGKDSSDSTDEEIEMVLSSLESVGGFYYNKVNKIK